MSADGSGAKRRPPTGAHGAIGARARRSSAEIMARAMPKDVTKVYALADDLTLQKLARLT